MQNSSIGTRFGTHCGLILVQESSTLEMTGVIQISMKEAKMSYYSPPITCSNSATITDFNQANLRGRIGRIMAFLMGSSNQLMDLETICQGKCVTSSHYLGTKTVKIAEIKGSENSAQDFDRKFNPLKNHNVRRWISIASAWQQGTSLPAVDLIKIGNVYIVRDGHHRISVARHMGCDAVDAHVTGWVLEN
jgi:hypothetical protein